MAHFDVSPPLQTMPGDPHRRLHARMPACIYVHEDKATLYLQGNKKNAGETCETTLVCIGHFLHSQLASCFFQMGSISSIQGKPYKGNILNPSSAHYFDPRKTYQGGGAGQTYNVFYGTPSHPSPLNIRSMPPCQMLNLEATSL